MCALLSLPSFAQGLKQLARYDQFAHRLEPVALQRSWLNCPIVDLVLSDRGGYAPCREHRKSFSTFLIRAIQVPGISRDLDR